MCSCRRKQRRARDRSKRSAKKRLLSRWRSPPREKSWPRARSNIVKRSTEERERSAALASELATAQRNVETQVAQSNKTANEAAQLKKAADIAALRNCSGSASDAEALASELATVRREVEAAAAVSSRKDDEAVQQKQAAETAIAELQQSLQQEQKKTAALMQEAKARAGDDGELPSHSAARSKRHRRVPRPRERACGNTARDRDPGRAVAKGSR